VLRFSHVCVASNQRDSDTATQLLHLYTLMIKSTTISIREKLAASDCRDMTGYSRDALLLGCALAGLPVAVKDLTAVKGLPFTKVGAHTCLPSGEHTRCKVCMTTPIDDPWPSAVRCRTQ
jgi:hypothetical protein